MKPTCNCYHSKLTVPTGYTDRSCMHWVSAIQVRSYPVWFFPSLGITRVTILVLAKAATFSSQKKKLRLLSRYYHQHHPIIEVCLSLHLYELMEALRYHLVSCKLAIHERDIVLCPHVLLLLCQLTAGLLKLCCCRDLGRSPLLLHIVPTIMSDSSDIRWHQKLPFCCMELFWLKQTASAHLRW